VGLDSQTMRQIVFRGKQNLDVLVYSTIIVRMKIRETNRGFNGGTIAKMSKLIARNSPLKDVESRTCLSIANRLPQNPILKFTLIFVRI